MSPSRGKPAVPNVDRPRTPTSPSTKPRAVPAADRRTASMRSALTWPFLLAPRALRTANSRTKASPRANVSAATFVQARTSRTTDAVKGPSTGSAPRSPTDRFDQWCHYEVPTALAGTFGYSARHHRGELAPGERRRPCPCERGRILRRRSRWTSHLVRGRIQTSVSGGSAKSA